MTDITSKIPRPEHPRPNFQRSGWLNLNGTWAFDFDDAEQGEKEQWYKQHDYSKEITVPFAYQSDLSGIGDESFHDVVWYSRTFSVPEDLAGQRILLHFGAVDYFAKVWLDGQYLGSHKGGYLPFAFDITNAVQVDPSKEFRLTVRAEDTRSCSQPRGKQNWLDEPHGCWYTPVTGIWQTVWLEAVGSTYIERTRITPQFDEGKVQIEAFLNRVPQNSTLTADIQFGGKAVNKVRVDIHEQAFTLTIDLQKTTKVDAIHYWHPHHPNLYDLELTIMEEETIVDSVTTYFGMRKIHADGDQIYLNNIPLYQKLVLDQGYWPDGLLTPPTDEAIVRDIELTKQMGFNGARKHQKIEDPRYYYWADKLGLLVWGEMPSAYDFGNLEVKNVMDEMQAFIERDYNHPSIITWVPLNESWGVRQIYANKDQQRFADGLYHMIRAYDATRLVSTNDGWEQVDADIAGVHDYTAWEHQLSHIYENVDELVAGAPNRDRTVFAQGYEYSGQPIMVTEYGGIAFAKDATDGNWGYNGAVENEASFLERYSNITNAFRKMTYMRGYCYTQLTDVFHEVNGLLDMDRNPKVSIEEIAKVNR